MKNLKLVFLALGLLLFLIIVLFPSTAYASTAAYDPQLSTITCADGRQFPNITVCFSGNQSCTADKNPCK
jgi:hypothetical protein